MLNDDLDKLLSVGQSEGLSIPRSSVRFRLKPDTSNSHEFELHRPSNKGTKLLLKVIKAIIIIPALRHGFFHKKTARFVRWHHSLPTIGSEIMMMIAFITFKSSLVPLLEGL